MAPPEPPDSTDQHGLARISTDLARISYIQSDNLTWQLTRALWRCTVASTVATDPAAADPVAASLRTFPQNLGEPGKTNSAFDVI